MVDFFRYLHCWFVVQRARLMSDETGASAVEYGVMVALIAAVIVAAVGILGGQVKDAFCTVVDKLGGTCETG